MDKPKPSPPSTRKRFYTIIPTYASLSPEEQAATVTHGYPHRVVDHLPEHEEFLDYLIDVSFEDWTRAGGAGR